VKENKKCIFCEKDLSIYKDKIEDFLVSNETFSLKICESCGVLYTSPFPAKNKINEYYKSDQYLSHSEKPKSPFEKLYFLIRNFNIKLKYRIIKKYKKKIEYLLDYGCGTGEFLSFCANKKMICVGYEPEENARKIANKKSSKFLSMLNDKNIIKENYYKKFDVVTLWHVLEHIYELEEIMALIKNALNQNGILFIALPNYESYDAKFYGNRWAGYDVPRHLYHFNYSAVKNLAKNNNLKIIKIKPLIFDSFFVSLLSEKNLKNPFYLIRGFFIGFISNLAGFLKIKPYSSQIYIIKKQ